MDRIAARILFLALCFAPSARATVLADQPFGPSPQPWDYTLDPDPVAPGFHPSLSQFGVTDDLGNFTLGSGDFLGVRNAGDHNVELRFDYRVRDFDPGESVGYELFLDGIGQGDTALIAGQSARSDVTGSVAIPLPNAADTMSLVLRVRQPFSRLGPGRPLQAKTPAQWLIWRSAKRSPCERCAKSVSICITFDIAS